jgi:hypothetical protein
VRQEEEAAAMMATAALKTLSVPLQAPYALIMAFAGLIQTAAIQFAIQTTTVLLTLIFA